MDPLLLIILLTVAAAGCLMFLLNSRSARTYTPSVSDIEEHEARVRAETKYQLAKAEHDDAVLKAETARASLEDIRALIKNERRR
jgi:hypothetical protein